MKKPKLYKGTILLTFAFKSEAKAFFQNHSFKKKLAATSIYTGVIKGIEHLIVLTGMGPYQARENLLKSLTELKRENYQISHLINLGIAGGLKRELKENDIVLVGSSAIEKSSLTYPLKILETTSKAPTQILNNLTVFKPILDKKSATNLGFEGIVDQELFALAKVSDQNNLKISAIKIISDLPFKKVTDFSSIKENLNQLGGKLHHFYTHNIKLEF